MEIKLEDNLLINSIINNRMHNSQKNKVELIIRPNCNQKCDYCYLTKYGSEIYPDSSKISNNQILLNLKYIIEYFLQKEYCIDELEIFAGDLFYDDFFFDIMEILYNFYKKTKKEKNALITIPCNMSFCNDSEKIKKVSQIISKFKEINITIYFSYSSDGIYATKTREHHPITEEFTDTVLSFCKQNNGGIHPMIGYENIDVAIKNYEWWKEKCSKFNIKVNNLPIPYFLEVRNNGWTFNAIQKYQEFLSYILNDIYKTYCNNSTNNFIENYFSLYTYNDNKFILNNKSNIYTFIYQKFSDTSAHCNLQNNNLTINCMNKTIVPCHRLAYPFLSGGHFELNSNNQLELKANENINGYINLSEYNNTDKPGCVTCPINSICMKGCIGAQFEYYGDSFFNIPDVCQLLKSKYKTLFNFYEEINLFDILIHEYPNFPDLPEILKIRNFFLNGGFDNE